MLKRDFLEKVREGDTAMPYPMTPARWLDDKPTITNILRLRMTCGGGVGGAQWFEYVKDTDFSVLSRTSRFVETENIDGEKMLINADYIVEAKPFRIASAMLHSDNPHFTKGNYMVRYLLAVDATAHLVHSL